MTSAESIDLDAESYYRLVLIVRGIAVSRPQNLVKFADSHTSIQDIVLEDPLESKPGMFFKIFFFNCNYILLLMRNFIHVFRFQFTLRQKCFSFIFSLTLFNKRLILDSIFLYIKRFYFYFKDIQKI